MFTSLTAFKFRWWVGSVAGLTLPMIAAEAQMVLPTAAIEQFQQTIGYRLEAVTVLGGDYSAAGGFYTFRGGDVTDLGLTKFGGSGKVASKTPLGTSDFEWAPVLVGNLGLLNANNTFQSGYLAGNETDYNILTVQGGVGAEIFFTERLSLVGTLSGIYAHSENTFVPHNPVGTAVLPLAQGTFVNWKAETWSVVPALELRYQHPWRRTTIQFSSHYSFFHTEDFNGSSPVIDVKGNSHIWENKVDVDVPTGLHVCQPELHVGGFFSRAELFGGVARGLDADYTYTANGRLVLQLPGHPWSLHWIGLGCSYFWGKQFSGWSAGADIKLEF